MTSVGGEVDIRNNASLTNLDGLCSLTLVGGNLWIGDCDTLTDLDGLRNITSVKRQKPKRRIKK